MTNTGRIWTHSLAIILGAVLMVGGIVARKTGAWIIGLLIAAINIEPWLRAMRARRSERQDP
jgi:hypothetical protein